MASIYAKQGVWYLSWSEAGKRVAKSLQLKSTRQNKKFAEQYKIDKERELLQGSSRIFNIRLSEAIKMFLSTKRTKEKNTISRYGRSLQIFLNFLGDVNVTQISNNDLISYELELKDYSIHTVESYIRDLRIFFSFLRASNLISNVTVRKEKRYSQKHIQVIPDDKIIEVLNYFESRNIEHYRYLKLLCLTGFRKGEALNLTWKDIDFNEQIIRLWNEKDNREDVFPLYPELLQFLGQFKSDGRVFSFVGSNHIAKILRKQFGLRFKDFRSTFATNKAKEFRTFELKELLRHNKVTTTEKYYVNVDVRKLRDRL